MIWILGYVAAFLLLIVCFIGYDNKHLVAENKALKADLQEAWREIHSRGRESYQMSRQLSRRRRILNGNERN